jgi:hypothetical protein
MDRIHPTAQTVSSPKPVTGALLAALEILLGAAATFVSTMMLLRFGPLPWGIVAGIVVFVLFVIAPGRIRRPSLAVGVITFGASYGAILIWGRMAGMLHGGDVIFSASAAAMLLGWIPAGLGGIHALAIALVAGRYRRWAVPLSLLPVLIGLAAGLQWQQYDEKPYLHMMIDAARLTPGTVGPWIEKQLHPNAFSRLISRQRQAPQEVAIALAKATPGKWLVGDSPPDPRDFPALEELLRAATEGGDRRESDSLFVAYLRGALQHEAFAELIERWPGREEALFRGFASTSRQRPPTADEIAKLESVTRRMLASGPAYHALQTLIVLSPHPVARTAELFPLCDSAVKPDTRVACLEQLLLLHYDYQRQGHLAEWRAIAPAMTTAVNAFVRAVPQTRARWMEGRVADELFFLEMIQLCPGRAQNAIDAARHVDHVEAARRHADHIDDVPNTNSPFHDARLFDLLGRIVDGELGEWLLDEEGRLSDADAESLQRVAVVARGANLSHEPMRQRLFAWVAQRRKNGTDFLSTVRVKTTGFSR